MEDIKEKLQKQMERVKAAENVRDPEMSHFHAEKAMLMALKAIASGCADHQGVAALALCIDDECTGKWWA